MKSSRVLKRQERRKEMKYEKDQHRGERLIKFGFLDYRWIKVTETIKKYKNRKIERAKGIRY